MDLFHMDWAYVYRDQDGCLRDEYMNLYNDTCQSFASDEEAEDYLEEHDCRANVTTQENVTGGSK
jgi:hypothetical protein